MPRDFPRVSRSKTRAKAKAKAKTKKTLKWNRSEWPLDEIYFIQDRTGSMSSLWHKVKSGVAEYIRGQQGLLGRRCRFSLMAFDSATPGTKGTYPHYSASSVPYFQTVVRCGNVEAIDPNTVLNNIKPRGLTPLHDAIMYGINEVSSRYKKASRSKRPETVTIVIYTDGQENASKRYNVNDVREAISDVSEKYGFNFLFLGAGIDAFAAGTAYGLNTDSIKGTHHNEIGTIGTMSAASAYSASLRSGGSIEQASSNFDDNYRAIVGVDPSQTSRKTGTRIRPRTRR